MIKLHIIFDFDCTIYKTSQALFSYYQEKYNDYSREYDSKLESWDMGDLIPLTKEEVNQFFNEEGFFKHLKPYDNAIDVLTELSKRHTLELVSLHSCEGMKYKYNFIKENLPIFHKITLYPLGEKFDKSMCSCTVAVDDRPDALESIDAEYKILYGEYSWNSDCEKFARAIDWDDIGTFINLIEAYENYIMQI